MLRTYTDALALINPAFDRRWIKFSAVFRDRFAQPICLTDYKTTTPDHPDPGRQPVPDRLLPAPPPRPHDQRVLRPRARGGAAGAGDRVSALLVAAGAALLWPVLAARHGRGDRACDAGRARLRHRGLRPRARARRGRRPPRSPLAAALVRLAWGRADGRWLARSRGPAASLWIAAVVIAVGVLVGARRRRPRPSSTACSRRGAASCSGRRCSGWGSSGCLRSRPAGTGGGRSGRRSSWPRRWARSPSTSARTAARASRPFSPCSPSAWRAPSTGSAASRSVARSSPSPSGIAALVACGTSLLMAQYRDGRIPRDDTVAFPRVARNAAATVSAAAGSPTAWPANWIFAARHGVSAARYDLLGGVDLFGRRRPWPRGRGASSTSAICRRTRRCCSAAGASAIPAAARCAAPSRARRSCWRPIREPRDVDVALVGGRARGRSPWR